MKPRAAGASGLLRMLFGSPGAGKSTYCVLHEAELGVVFSLDRARATVGRHEHDQTATPAAITWVCRQAREHLAAGGVVTIDTTGARPADRSCWLALARACVMPVRW